MSLLRRLGVKVREHGDGFGLWLALVLAVTKPLGLYLFQVFEGERQPLQRLFGPVERVLLRSCGVDTKRSFDQRASRSPDAGSMTTTSLVFPEVTAIDPEPVRYEAGTPAGVAALVTETPGRGVVRATIAPIESL